MLDNLTKRFTKVFKNIRGNAKLTEDNIKEALREVRLALLEADVSLPIVKDFVNRVKERALGQEFADHLTPDQAFFGIVNEELTELMGSENSTLNLASAPPAIVLMAGLQGAGKTTTVGKLSKLLKDQDKKKKILLVSADVYRPAAIEQLRLLAEQVNVDFFPSDTSQKPVEIALAAQDYAKKHFYDVLMVDTAGRLAIDEEMMNEIANLKNALHPDETLFVVDSMTGQDAANTAKEFNDRLDFDGVVLTKLDGDTRGGAALSIRTVVTKPIKFVGTGEKMEAIDAFHPVRMADRILGMGDIVSLVERAQEQFDEEEARRLQKKIQKNKFDFNDFLALYNAFTMTVSTLVLNDSSLTITYVTGSLGLHHTKDTLLCTDFNTRTMTVLASFCSATLLSTSAVAVFARNVFTHLKLLGNARSNLL